MKKTVLVISALLLSNVGHSATCNAGVPSSTPDSRFQILGTNEVKDLRTSLIWQRCSLGQSWLSNSCAGTANTYTWQDALVAASAQKAGGWRIPNIKELQTLVEEACMSPAINASIFPTVATDAIYFSSTPAVNDGGLTPWYVDFKKGFALYGAGITSAYVRLVRD